jgi:hypothetical protein
MFEYIIICAITIYFIYVIYKKIKNIRKGKFCDCGCENCSIRNKCK